jgi:hypothetical protein
MIYVIRNGKKPDCLMKIDKVLKLQERWDEVYSLDHKFYFNKRGWELFRKQKPIILYKFKWTRVNENI